ncbi:MAG: DPP IV N-terminal domain-containing protein, partial [Paramuribaculum sp.]|nr:DPP IV N-terminal domain-containing protein [Paramuribaculum sp.]
MTLRNIITATAAALALSATAAGVADFKDIDRYLGPEHYCAAPRSFTYTADGSFYLQLSTDGRKVVKYDTRTGKEVETIVDLANTRETTIDHIDGFKMSPDGRKVMVWNETSYIYRRSFTACYYIYDLHSRELKPLSTRHTRQQAPLFSPDGRMVAFVDQGNIYLCKLDFWTEVDVTTDGRKNEVINGVPDWTYEEEFTTSSSMTWSPDSRMLCYLKYRESDVRLFSFPLYEG